MGMRSRKHNATGEDTRLSPGQGLIVSSYLADRGYLLTGFKREGPRADAADPIPPPGLGGVERLVGPGVEGIQAGDGRRQGRDANADRDGQVPGRSAHGVLGLITEWVAAPPPFLQALAQTLRQVAGPLLVGFGQEDGEFLAPHAPDEVGGPDRLTAMVRHAAQDGIPGLMAMAVVDILEVVDVEDQQGQRLPVALRPRQVDRGAGVEMAAIGQAGEVVDGRAPLQLLPQKMQFRDVGGQADEAVRLSGLQQRDLDRPEIADLALPVDQALLATLGPPAA